MSVYTCDHCNETFDDGDQPEEEKLAEAKSLFVVVPPPEQRAILCDECFKAMRRAGILPS